MTASRKSTPYDQVIWPYRSQFCLRDFHSIQRSLWQPEEDWMQPSEMRWRGCVRVLIRMTGCTTHRELCELSQVLLPNDDTNVRTYIYQVLCYIQAKGIEPVILLRRYGC